MLIRVYCGTVETYADDNTLVESRADYSYHPQTDRTIHLRRGRLVRIGDVAGQLVEVDWNHYRPIETCFTAHELYACAANHVFGIRFAPEPDLVGIQS